MSTFKLNVALVALMLSTPVLGELNFNRVASFPTWSNNDDQASESSAEIIAATGGGNRLVYTDSGQEALGVIGIHDPSRPEPLGSIALPGEPTAVSVIGHTAFVGVNTSESYADPSGLILAIDLDSQAEIGRCNLGGQPDSVDVSADNSFLAIAIENERDEDSGTGRVPQMPAGFLVLVNASASGLDCNSLQQVDLTGLAEIAPEDPEPEFVDINAMGETVISLQENNHIVVVDANGEVISHFSAGAVDLTEIDTGEEGALLFADSQPGRVREPDAVKWIDDDHFATANEGDMDGGSRGWTIFHKSGEIVYESGASFEHALIEIGHYPEERSGNKGVEPESIEVGSFGGVPMVFVGAERASAVGVYDVSDPSAPQLLQILPSGIGPEGYVALPGRNLLISANEVDLGEDGGPRAHVMIYERGDQPAAYPMLTSAGADERIGWGAISGMAAGEGNTLYAVNDSFYALQPTIFEIDVSASPARITRAIRLTREGQPAQKLDLEGITTDGAGGFWLASEGRTDRLIPHALYHVSADGEIQQEVAFPLELLAVERRFGAEGITRIGDWLWIAIQREWQDDPENHVKLVAYNIETQEWGAVLYPKAVTDTGWVGLSEITAHGDQVLIVERDNQFGADARKVVMTVPAAQMVPAPLGSELPVVTPELYADLVPYLVASNGIVPDKVEGLAVMEDGRIYVSTDNDGVDDSTGETWFFQLEP